MEYLCLNCGHINFENEVNICENCQSENNSNEYQNLIAFANRAVHYGYQYRVAYEEQVERQGEIITKYSLLDPSTYLEFIAVAALSGVVGNLVYDIVKYVAKQVYNKLIEKQSHTELTPQEQNTINIISDSSCLNKFTIYVQNYYRGMPHIDTKVDAGIKEEEIIHSIIDDNNEELIRILQDADVKDFQQALGELVLTGLRSAAKKRYEKPKMAELNETLKNLKKDLKKMKKEQKKKK